MKKGLVQHLQTSQKCHGRGANEVHIFITAELAPHHAKVQDHRASADGFADDPITSHGWRAENSGGS